MVPPGIKPPETFHIIVSKYQLHCDKVTGELDPEMSLHDYDIDEDGVSFKASVYLTKSMQDAGIKWGAPLNSRLD